MTNMLKSLDTISTVYSIFEKDQVLTANQLNDVTSYLDDQDRLTRIDLIGVGIVCGLEASLQGNKVRVGKGVGITTDGDLIYFDKEMVFGRFKPYDETNPVYAPFQVEDAILPLYELTAVKSVDERAVGLSQFNTQTGKALDDMVVVALMESYAKDYDICSGTDCDNLGKDCVNTIKILLLDKANAGRLVENIATPHRAYSELDLITVNRPMLAGTFNTVTQLAKPYRDAASAVHVGLTNVLAKLYPSCSSFVSEVFAKDPAPVWIKNLENLKSSVFGNSNAGIQYYHDYLKDVVETYHAFRECLFGDRTLCCPSIDAFPKHLLLGNLVPGANLEENRTSFYPSPAIGCCKGRRSHALFLLRKLDVLLKSFKLPSASSSSVIITPSRSEKSDLEERAIPYYYNITSKTPVHDLWNYGLYRRQAGNLNYSYNAAAYKAQGAAANPLHANIGKFDFFRIEGHLGQNVKTVMTTLNGLIKSRNLPIALQAVFIGSDRTKITIRPNIRYTDLHRFHYLLRQDLTYQMDDIKSFSDRFKTKVDAAVDSGVVNNTSETTDGITVKGIAEQKHSAIQTKSLQIKQKLNVPYLQYKADLSWKSDLNDTMLTAGEFKNDLAKVVKTEFNTPFDTLIGSTTSRWLDWLDAIIKRRDDNKDDKLLFGRFLSEHTGCEHFAGVVPGGTFVLVYDDSNTVVADCMLPYRVCDEDEADADEPTLNTPTIKPNWVIQNGLNVLPSLDKFVVGKLDTFKVALNAELMPKFDTQQLYLNVFKDSIDVMGTALNTKYTGGVDIKSPDISGSVDLGLYRDKQLGYFTNDVNNTKALVDYYDAQLSQPGLDAATTKEYQVKRSEAETKLVESMDQLGTYVASQPQDVNIGSETYNSMLVISKGVEAVKDNAAKETLRTKLAGSTGTQEKPAYDGMVNMIFRK